MPTVFDNIETPFLDGEASNGLKHALKLAFRGDFCVGYFNLRGWRCIDDVVNEWPIPEETGSPPPARLLVGMQRMPHDQLRSWLSDDPEKAPDNKQLAKLRKDAAAEHLWGQSSSLGSVLNGANLRVVWDEIRVS